MDGDFGWAGYVVELQIGEGQYEAIHSEVLSGFAALPFYNSPLPSEFLPPPPPALPADLAGAVTAINHGLDPADLFAALPFYDAPLPADFFELAVPVLPADLAGAGAAINHGLDAADLFAALPFYDAPLPADFFELTVLGGLQNLNGGDNGHNIGHGAQVGVPAPNYGNIGHGAQVQLVFPPANNNNDHNIGDGAQVGHGVQLVFPPANDHKDDDPWKEEASGKFGRYDDP